MNRIGMIYMCASWLMLGLIIGYSTASSDVIRMKTSIVMEEMVK